jgi:tetratricopeptide (TPR) repeat protein
MIPVIVLLLLLFNPAFILGAESDLAEFFRSQSIPVTAVENQAGVVVVKANFRLADNPDLEQLRPMLSMIFSKAAQTFPNSSRIQVDYSIENALIASLSLDAGVFLDPGRAAGWDSVLYSEMNVEAADQALAVLHEGWDIIEDQAEDFAETENLAETEELVIGDAGEETELETQEKIDLSDQIQLVDDGLTAYVGAVFAKHDGEGIKLLGVLEDTPAQNTGLQKGDVILEVEDISFRDKGAQPEVFTELMQKLPPDKPLRFHIEREGKRFDVWIKPLRIDEGQLAAFQNEIQEKYGSDYSRGTQLMDQENYTGAMEYFQRSLKANSRVMESYQGLGVCYFYLGEHKKARKSFENAIKLDKKQPLSWFYGALNMDALDRRNGAIDGYKRYLKLNHDNARMTEFARVRLEELKQGRRFDWSKRLLEVIEAIRKEIEK